MATIRSSRSEADTRIPVSTGRVSSREAEPATFSAVETNASAGSETAESASGSGKGGKSSARSVRMWNVALPETSSTSCSAARSSSETCGEGSGRTTSSSSRAGRTTTPSRATSASTGTRRPTSISVARSSQPFEDAGELDARERLDRAARRGDAADGLELSEQGVALEGDLHDEYLRRKVEVIGDRSCGERPDSAATSGKVVVWRGQASVSTTRSVVLPRTKAWSSASSSTAC